MPHFEYFRVVLTRCSTCFKCLDGARVRRFKMMDTTVSDTFDRKETADGPLRPLPADFSLIAGPCSAESLAQLRTVAAYLDGLRRQGYPVEALRAGVWKPRTRPGHFEGYGEEALGWLRQIRAEYPDLPLMTEVATPAHAQAALKAGISRFWVGARTVSNPFTVQALADSLRGSGLTVRVKNPVSPDLALWIGAMERLEKAGLKVEAVHRGFGLYNAAPYRNAPLWELPIELKQRCPGLRVLCDPSHIAGQARYVAEVAQLAVDLEMNGLMVELHPAPETALSDAAQQLTPEAFSQLLSRLHFKDRHTNSDRLETLRHLIDETDRELIGVLARRFDLVRQMGAVKKEENLSVLQLQRWQTVLDQRAEWAQAMGLSPEFIKALFRCIHTESVEIQR